MPRAKSPAGKALDGKAPHRERFVLDAYALLAYFFDEPGGDRIRGLIEQSGEGTSDLYTCVVTITETLYWTQRRRGAAAFTEIADGLASLPIRQVEVDHDLGIEAARLKASNPIALAACYAAALALRLDATLITDGSEFREFEPALTIERLGVPYA